MKEGRRTESDRLWKVKREKMGSKKEQKND